ncbi:unnamed protein product [Absidia cylindrospora]
MLSEGWIDTTERDHALDDLEAQDNEQLDIAPPLLSALPPHPNDNNDDPLLLNVNGINNYMTNSLLSLPKHGNNYKHPYPYVGKMGIAILINPSYTTYHTASINTTAITILNSLPLSHPHSTNSIIFGDVNARL